MPFNMAADIYRRAWELEREKIVNGTCFSVWNDSSEKRGQPFQATH